MRPAPESSTNRPKNLTNNPALDINPAFSPGGKKITFESSRDGAINIFKMHADGTHQLDITNSTSTFYHAPSWQPDP